MTSKSKYKGKSNGKKRENKNSKRVDRADNKHSDTDIDMSDRINDASYYFWNDDLKRQITNISFNQFNGVPNYMGTVTNSTGVVDAFDTIPYAMRIELSPSAGFTGGEYSVVGNAINLAALNLYTNLSANNAKTTNYAPQDLTTLILGLGSIISMSSHITRAFGLAYLYNQRNRAYPKKILEVAGFDYEDLIGNFADYRVRFNNLMTAANKIPIPANIPYLTKCSQLYNGLYWDMEGSDMAQTYIFVPGTEWYFNEEYSEQGTGLETLNIFNQEATTHTMDWYLTYLDQMIGSMLNSATLNSIYSDILRVSTKEGIKLYQFMGVSETYTVLPSYVPEIRRWINNATICGYPLEEPTDNSTKSNDVVPDVAFNRIDYRPRFAFSAIGMDADMYINFDSPNPNDDEIIEATRLVSRFKVEWNGSSYVTTEAALPDHYVNRLVIFGDDAETTTVVVTSSVGTTAALYRSLVCFDWHPAMYVYSATGVAASFIDLNYYTTLDFNYVKRLQDATYLGLLTIR